MQGGETQIAHRQNSLSDYTLGNIPQEPIRYQDGKYSPHMFSNNLPVLCHVSRTVSLGTYDHTLPLSLSLGSPVPPPVIGGYPLVS